MAAPLIVSEVPNVTPSIQYVATDGQTVFPYPFPITQDSDLVCTVNGVALPTDSGYTLSGQGNDTGGNLTFSLGQTAGTIITLYRDIPIQRISQIAQNSGFSSTTFNAEFNNIYLIMQQLQESISLCLQLPITNSPVPNTTLAPVPFANAVLGFDGFGNPKAVGFMTPGANSATTFTGAINSAPNILYTRNSAYSGGTTNFTTPLMELVTNVSNTGDTNNEWVFVAILNNASATGENVAGYFQGNKTGNVGATWGAVIEVVEQAHINNPTAGTVGLEVDVTCNGTDNSGAGNRIGIDLVVRRYDFTGGAPAAQANWGYRIDTSDAGASVGFGFGFYPGSTANIGFDASQATMDICAFQLAQSQPIIFDGPTAQLHKLLYDGVGLAWQISGVSSVRIAPAALQIVTAGTLVQVVGPQQTTGVAAATFLQVDTTTAVSTDSTFDGYTLKQVVKALRLHGLLA